jgi:hypothetical protein
VALVTDHDAGVDGVDPVTMDEVFAVMRSNDARREDHRCACCPPRRAPDDHGGAATLTSAGTCGLVPMGSHRGHALAAGVNTYTVVHGRNCSA